MPASKRQLIMYSTLGCHLCDLAEQVILTSGILNNCEVEIMDIAEDDVLIDQYGIRIPVVKDSESSSEIGWPFDAGGLLKWFNILDSY